MNNVHLESEFTQSIQCNNLKKAKKETLKKITLNVIWICASTKQYCVQILHNITCRLKARITWCNILFLLNMASWFQHFFFATLCKIINGEHLDKPLNLNARFDWPNTEIWVTLKMLQMVDTQKKFCYMQCFRSRT